MRPPLRLYRDPSGVDPRALRPGQDLVLDAHPRYGLDLTDGVLIDDYLSTDDRRAIDSAAAAALARWREAHDEALTIDGVCMPWVWELELFSTVFLPAARAAVGVRRALEAYGGDSVEVVVTEEQVASVARAAGANVRMEPPRAARRATEAPPRPRLARRAREAAKHMGIPSSLRSGSVVVIGYWHLTTVVDRMLGERLLRPALSLHAPIPGRARSLRVARRGGWIGTASLGDRRFGAREAEELAARTVRVPLATHGCSLDDLIEHRAKEFVRERGARDGAFLRVLRRAFAAKRVACVVVPFDVPTEARLVVTMAKAEGVPTVVVQHGGYLEAERYADLQVAETVVLWSETALPALAARTDGVVIVGYPGEKNVRGDSDESGRTQVVVLGESLYTTSTVRDARQMQRHDRAAIEGILAAESSARIVLRPHPSSGREAADAVRRRYPDSDIVVDTTSDIFSILRASHACIGTYSTAAMQSAIVGTPVVLLNVAGEDFPWPLGGDTRVPIVRSSDGLAAALRTLLRDPRGEWGREDLLRALGVSSDDAVGRIVDVIAERALG